METPPAVGRPIAPLVPDMFPILQNVSVSIMANICSSAQHLLILRSILQLRILILASLNAKKNTI